MKGDSKRPTLYSGDDPILTATGKEMGEWIWILDLWGGGNTDFSNITRYLIMHYRLHSFWAQAVATHYIRDDAQYRREARR